MTVCVGHCIKQLHRFGFICLDSAYKYVFCGRNETNETKYTLLIVMEESCSYLMTPTATPFVTF